MNLRRNSLCPLLLLFAASAISSTPIRSQQQVSGLANTTVLIIRHGEKPETGMGLTQEGQERAKAYVGYFRNFKVGARPFHVDYLFATADSKKSARERLTVEPLSQALKLTIDNRFKNGEFSELADALRAKHYGNDILICWHHGKIPNLVQALGGDSEKLIPGGKWPETQFGWVIQLVFDRRGNLIPSQSKRVSENLMPSDRAAQ